MSYGKELIIDLHGCDPATFTRESLETYFAKLCSLIDMERAVLHFWDYEGEPEEYKEAPDHLKGTSAIQFITTSNITIHTLDALGKVFLNVFSCKEFDHEEVVEFSRRYFGGCPDSWQIVERK